MATTVIAHTTHRRPTGQRLLLLASFGVIIGSFLPWVETGFGVYRGFAGGGATTFYAGVFGLAGALVPSRKLAMVQGSITALVGVGIAVWQVANLLMKVGISGWTPGIGLVLVFGAGVYAARAVWVIHGEA